MCDVRNKQFHYLSTVYFKITDMKKGDYYERSNLV
jgi:hypothetical protein